MFLPLPEDISTDAQKRAAQMAKHLQNHTPKNYKMKSKKRRYIVWINGYRQSHSFALITYKKTFAGKYGAEGSMVGLGGFIGSRSKEILMSKTHQASVW